MSNGIHIHACIYILYLIRAKDRYTNVNGGACSCTVDACTSACRYLYCSRTVLVRTRYGTVQYKSVRDLVLYTNNVLGSTW